MVVLISYEVGFRTKMLTTDKERHSVARGPWEKPAILYMCMKPKMLWYEQLEELERKWCNPQFQLGNLNTRSNNR